MRLTLRETPPSILEMGALNPALAAQQGKKLGHQRLFRGQSLALGDLFSIDLKGAVDVLEIVADSPLLQGVGRALEQGSIRIEGRIGAAAGAAMRGGRIEVHGDVGSGAGQAMCGGLLTITGNAGDYLAAAATGERCGMRGGMIQVTGSVGDYAGHRMRSGMLLIGRDAGRFLAADMCAGTIFLAGKCLGVAAWGMRRGSLFLSQEPAEWPTGFVYNGCHNLSFLGMVQKLLLRHNFPYHWQAQSHRYLGDRCAGGKGEVFLAEKH